MAQTPTNSTQTSPSDYAGVNLDSSETIGDFASTQAQNVKAVAVEKAQKFRTYAGEKAVAIKQETGIKIKQGTAKAKEIHVSAEDYVREHPTKSILGAVSVGVIIGLIMRR